MTKDRQYWIDAIHERACIIYDASFACEVKRGPDHKCKIGDTEKHDCPRCPYGKAGMTWDDAQQKAKQSVKVENERYMREQIQKAQQRRECEE